MMGYWSHVYKLRSDLQQKKGVGATELAMTFDTFGRIECVHGECRKN